MDKNLLDKFIFFGLFIFTLLLFPLSAEGMREKSEPDAVTQPTMEAGAVTVSLAVLKGPSGFGFVHLLGEGGDLGMGVTVDAEVLPSPNEALARVVSGEVDMAALPAAAAALLYNKGVPIQLAAVTGEGNLFFLSRADQAEQQSADQAVQQGADRAEQQAGKPSGSEIDFSAGGAAALIAAGKRVSVPAPGSTPDLVTRYLLDVWGIGDEAVDDLLDFSISAPAQLAQMLIAGKIDYAVLPEPFATMSELKSPEVVRSGDLQEAWQAVTGLPSYPMTVLIVRRDFAEDRPRALGWILDAVEDSIRRVTEDPAAGALLIEQYGILAADLAEPSIPRCALMFEPAATAAESYAYYLSVLAELNPAAFGGVLPDEAFYLGY